ncbi:G8 domain-containing protein DDB_G0286311 isoform X1 [Polistes fuscatus]|uniref:G8 domain-containing protein DDB_G0286311 isoform X1 n=1 Tax=Polistes fuscatus TaxID=30207 RepID=UPI001CA9B96F|nr:G8 domain-containing protein DDB_G0286311 isoform X1 [Polistes fuscatus]
MAIMQSCCCWQSVRRGSYACAIYTGIYFALLAIITGTILQAESEYLSGNRSLPESSSILELGTISPATLRFNITLLICSCSGIICSILLVYGLLKDKRIFLLPWIVNMISCSTIDISHVLYLIFITPNFNPIMAMLYTLNFFLLCLNVYSLLCVISQYQEYLADRGTAADDNNYRVSILKVSRRKGQRDKGGKVPVVRYTVQPTTTATSCLSSRKGTTNNETKTTPTPTQSPTTSRYLSFPIKSPTVGRAHKKHVQFPDTPTSTSSSTPTAIPMSMEKSEIPLTNSNAK